MVDEPGRFRPDGEGAGRKRRRAARHVHDAVLLRQTHVRAQVEVFEVPLLNATICSVAFGPVSGPV